MIGCRDWTGPGKGGRRRWGIVEMVTMGIELNRGYIMVGAGFIAFEMWVRLRLGYVVCGVGGGGFGFMGKGNGDMWFAFFWGDVSPPLCLKHYDVVRLSRAIPLYILSKSIS